jgi:hypothetical protein
MARVTEAKQSNRLDDVDMAYIIWMLATKQPQDAIREQIKRWGKRVAPRRIRAIAERNGDKIKALARHLHMRIPSGALATAQQRFAKLEEIADDVERRMNACEDREYANLLAKYLTVIKQIGDEVGNEPPDEEAAPERPRREITLADLLSEDETLDRKTERDLFRALRRAQAAAAAVNGSGGEDQPGVADGQ